MGVRHEQTAWPQARGASGELHVLGWSLAAALIYAVTAAIYIRVSSAMASRMAASVQDLERLERLKGWAFVAVTALLLFLLLFAVLSRIQRGAREIVLHRDALLVAERHAMAGVMAAATAHDCRNVLTSLELALSELHDIPQLSDGDIALVDSLEKGVTRLAEITANLVRQSREALPGEMREVDLAETVRDAVDMVRRHRSLRDATIRVEPDDVVHACLNPALVHQLLCNLLLNAGEATDGKGQILVRVIRTQTGTQLEVHDNGPGIPKERRAEVFRPFYTTKPQGSGLGLLSVRACAEAQGGAVEIVDSQLGGACFRVTIPDAATPR